MSGGKIQHECKITVIDRNALPITRSIGGINSYTGQNHAGRWQKMAAGIYRI